MSTSNGRIIRSIRISAQILFILIFIILFFYPPISSFDAGSSTSVFFYLDPLILLTKVILTGKIVHLFLFSLIPLVLTLFLGRFFCGWVCPFGTLNQFFSWLFQKWKSRKQQFNKNILKVKYYILILVLGSTIIGMNITGWIDPFSLFTRSLTVISPSGEFLIQKVGLVEKTKQVNPNTIIPQTNDSSSETELRNFARSSGQSLLIGGIFLVILGLNYYHRRFFCNVICPLGAMYGLVSRFGLFHFKTSPTCNSCNACSRNCTYNGNAGDNYLKSECISCFNCVVECPSDSVQIKFELPKKSNHTPIDLGRRKMFASLGAGIALATLTKIQPSSKPKRRHSFIRPPGAIAEHDFISKCSSCGQCTQSCPTGFIKPAFLNAGIEGLWTPIASAESGYCIYECNKCTQVCPTEAIEKISLKEKQKFKIGLAVIDKNRCYTYADGINCTVCYDKCPTKEKAIIFKEAEVWNYKGRLTNVKQIHVLSDLCIGCGICEYVCPRNDAPGIIIVSENEYREMDEDLF